METNFEALRAKQTIQLIAPPKEDKRRFFFQFNSNFTLLGASYNANLPAINWTPILTTFIWKFHVSCDLFNAAGTLLSPVSSRIQMTGAAGGGFSNVPGGVTFNANAVLNNTTIAFGFYNTQTGGQKSFGLAPIKLTAGITYAMNLEAISGAAAFALNDVINGRIGIEYSYENPEISQNSPASVSPGAIEKANFFQP